MNHRIYMVEVSLNGKNVILLYSISTVSLKESSCLIVQLTVSHTLPVCLLLATVKDTLMPSTLIHTFWFLILDNQIYKK